MKLIANIFWTALFWIGLGICVLVGRNAMGAECNGVYHGMLIGALPNDPYAVTYEGTLTDYYNDGESAWFLIDGDVVRIQNPNVYALQFDNNKCMFNGAFHADPIFHNGFEG